MLALSGAHSMALGRSKREHGSRTPRQKTIYRMATRSKRSFPQTPRRAKILERANSLEVTAER